MQNQSEPSTILSSRDKLTVAIEGGLMLLMNFVAFAGNFFPVFGYYQETAFPHNKQTYSLCPWPFVICFLHALSCHSLLVL